MKFALLVLAGLIGTSALAAESARAPKQWREKSTIKFAQGERTYENTLNLMDDGIEAPEGYTFAGYALKFTLQGNEDFSIFAKAVSNGQQTEFKCEYEKPIISGPKGKKKGLRQVVINLNADPETDSGDACVYTVDFADGRRAVVSVISEGT